MRSHRRRLRACALLTRDRGVGGNRAQCHHISEGHAMTNPIMRPILLAVDDHIQDLETIRRELLKRYGVDYDVQADHSTASALQRLEELQAAGAQVAILLAAFEMTVMTGIRYLEQAHALHPNAKRVLLLAHSVRWG